MSGLPAVRSTFRSPDIWWRIGGAGLVAMFLSPFFFFGFNYIAYVVGYDPSPEEQPER